MALGSSSPLNRRLRRSPTRVRTISNVRASTRKLWDLQNRHEGDRVRLYRAVREFTGARTVLYPGSFVDISASAVFPDVTYVDTDRRAAAFFEDESGVREILGSLRGDDGNTFSFVDADYRELDLPPRSFDLLLSLYAGLVSEHCTPFLRAGGFLLANPSHGDVAMASIDERYVLAGVVESQAGRYHVRDDRLDGYLVPKKPVDLTPDLVRRQGRGIAYTRSAFAYLFTRVG